MNGLLLFFLRSTRSHVIAAEQLQAAITDATYLNDFGRQRLLLLSDLLLQGADLQLQTLNLGFLVRLQL